MEELAIQFREEPIITFAILLAIILIIPPVFERLKLPGLLGLLLAGVILGPNVLHVVSAKSETMELLSDIGLVYLMFVAGLEIDLEQFNKVKDRAATFGGFTFLFPLIMGVLVGRLFGFGWNASVLLGSIFSSHTLLAYPIVSRLGVVSNEAVTITIGATIITDIGALLVLAVCVGINTGDFSLFKLITLLVSLLLYSGVILFGFDRLGKEFFERSGDEEGNQFLFILLVVFLSALGAELIGVEKIVGAFLAGIAVNEVLGESPVKEKVVFVGSVLFIPIFFVDLGLIIDINSFLSSLSSIGLVVAISGGLLLGKFIAAYGIKWLYGYSWDQALTMWSLSIPQVAATLAATLVGYRVGLLTLEVLNSVVVLMVITSTLGTLLTKKFASGLVLPGASSEEISYPWTPEMFSDRFKVMVPVYNPNTEQYLVELASLLARHESGEILPLAVATAHMHMDAKSWQMN
jgi:Kef-type K+ transport system membrane component KefB